MSRFIKKRYLHLPADTSNEKRFKVTIRKLSKKKAAANAVQSIFLSTFAESNIIFF